MHVTYWYPWAGCRVQEGQKREAVNQEIKVDHKQQTQDINPEKLDEEGN